MPRSHLPWRLRNIIACLDSPALSQASHWPVGVAKKHADSAAAVYIDRGH